MVFFSHPIPILWYTSAYGKFIGFPINFPQYGKMQQNSWCREILGNWYSLFSHSMGAFFPLDSHSMVYLIIWEIHGFPYQFFIVREDATKLIVWGEPGKLVLIIFPYYGRIFSIRFPFYSILHHMGNACVFSLISHNLGKDSKAISWGNFGKLVPGNIQQNPVYVENLGNRYSYFSHCMGAFFPIRFTFYGILDNI